MKALRQIATLTRKDFKLQFRSKETLALIFVFTILVVLIFIFAYGQDSLNEIDESDRAKLVASVLWATFIFAGIITMNRSFTLERTHGALHGIRLTGVDASNVYLSKVISNVVLLMSLEIIITPITLQFFGPFQNVSIGKLSTLFGILSIGTIGFCAVGVLLAAMSTTTSGGESLLSVILLPLVVPIIMGGAKCTVSILTTGSLTETKWLTLLIVSSLVFFAVAYLLADVVIEQ